VRHGEDEDGDGREQRGGGQDARLVGVSAEVTDSHDHQHVPAVNSSIIPPLLFDNNNI